MLQKGAITVWDTSPTGKGGKTPGSFASPSAQISHWGCCEWFEHDPEPALCCGCTGAAGIPAGCGAVPVACSQEALSVPREGCSEGFPARALPGCVASSIQGRDLVMIPFGLLEPPRAKGTDTTGSQVKWGQLLPGAKAPPYTFLSGNETVLPPHP